MSKVVVYVEGGGTTRSQQQPLRQGFRTLFETVIVQTRDMTVVACGGRNEAYRDFARALKEGRHDLVLLLIDSEGPVNHADVWQHFLQGPRENDRQFTRPPEVKNDQAHLMVQMMESWFVTDVAALESYYGQGLQTNSLPGNVNIEQILKGVIIPSLENATRQTRKGKYSKDHGFHIIASVNVAELRQKSPHANRFFTVLQRELGQRK